MDRMLHLLGGCEGGILFRYHFISILSIYVKNYTLALSTPTDLQQLALEADRIFLSGQPDNSTVMSTTSDDSTTEVSRIQRNNSKHHTSRTLCFFHERFRSRAKKCVQPCDWSGSAVVNAVNPDHPAQLLVNDNHSGRTFLIDTGAQVSLLPAKAHARRHPSPTAPKLVAANGSSIASYGTQQTHVQLGKRKFTVTFIIADVRRPILGADFLRRPKLLVDLCGQKLIDAHSCAATITTICVCPQLLL